MQWQLTPGKLALKPIFPVGKKWEIRMDGIEIAEAVDGNDILPHLLVGKIFARFGAHLFHDGFAVDLLVAAHFDLVDFFFRRLS